MRTLYFLVPGTGDRFACGGLWAELKTFNLTQQIGHSAIVTYRQRETDTLFLDDVLTHSDLDRIIFVISWGFDIPKLVDKLQQHNVVYHAHSAGYGFKIPASIPIITVSKNTMGYWGQNSPHSLIYYLPNQISDQFKNVNIERDIDVLVQARKSSEYLLYELIPALQQECNVVVVDSYIDDLPGLFNRAKVYLYDSAEYWAQQRVSEGFGLQPMEALACGCQVFSSLNGGLSDYLDPGFNCYKIAGYSKEYDLKRILNVVRHSTSLTLSEEILNEYRSERIIQRLQVIFDEINDFFDHRKTPQTPIKNITKLRLITLMTKRIIHKLKNKYVKA